VELLVLPDWPKIFNRIEVGTFWIRSPGLRQQYCFPSDWKRLRFDSSDQTTRSQSSTVQFLCSCKFQSCFNIFVGQWRFFITVEIHLVSRCALLAVHSLTFLLIVKEAPFGVRSLFLLISDIISRASDSFNNFFRPATCALGVSFRLFWTAITADWLIPSLLEIAREVQQSQKKKCVTPTLTPTNRP